MITRRAPIRLAAISIAGLLPLLVCQGSAAQSPARDSEEGVAAITTPATISETEPNGTMLSADSIAALLTAERYVIVSAALDPGGDVDYFSFTAPLNSQVWIATDSGGPMIGGATSRDTVVDLLEFDGDVIESDDNDGTGNGGDATVESELASVIAGRVLNTTSYFIRVSAASASDTVNPYRLLVVLTQGTSLSESEN